MENSCEKIIPMISAYIDGELSPFDEKRLKQHLETCPSCRNILADYQAAYSSRFLSEPPPGLHDSIMAQIRSEPKPRRRLKTPFRYGTAAAAVIALVLLGASGTFGNLFSSLQPKEVSVQRAEAAMDTAMAESAAEVFKIPAEIDAYSLDADAKPQDEAPVEEEAAAEAEEEAAEAAPMAEATMEEDTTDEYQLMTFTALVTSLENGSYGCIVSYDSGENAPDENKQYLPQELFIEQELLGSEPLSPGDRITVTVAVTGSDDDPIVDVIDVVVDHEE